MPPSPLAIVFCAPDRPELPGLVSGPPDHWSSARLLKQHRGTTVALVPSSAGTVVVKHHDLRSWRHRVEALVHGSPGRRAWHGAQLLQAGGFLVPRPLAVVEKRNAGTVCESFYFSEALLTPTPLNTYWRTQHRHWSLRQRRTFLRALAEFVRQFHAAGFYVGDMKDENILVELHEESQWRFYLVDLDRVTRSASLSQRRRLKNLVQLERTLGRNVRASDRLFFLYQYLGTPLPSPRQRRVLLTRLWRLRRRKDREYARRRVRHSRPPGAQTLSALSHPLPIPHATPPERMPVSCCIICYNEEANIRRCLESVKWCDEIVIVDSFSTDRTVEICREYTDRIIQRPWPGYVEQKRFALSQATHEWVLNVDADEEVSPELQCEGLAVLQRNDPSVDGFYIPRLVYYLGRWWWHGWYPGYRLRLFRKAKVRWGGVNPHEKVLLRGQADHLRGDLYHYTYEDIGDHLNALNHLTEVASHEMIRRGKRTTLSHLLWHPLWRFFRFYVVRGCFRDGVPGFFVAVTSAFYVFLKYAKLWEAASRQWPAHSGEGVTRGSGDAVGRG
jgi:hypothetical protein